MSEDGLYSPNGVAPRASTGRTASLEVLEGGTEVAYIDRWQELSPRHEGDVGIGLGTLSVSDLRIELRTAQGVLKADTGTDAGSVKSSETTDVVVCPQCGFELRPPTIDAKGHDEPGSGDANGHRLT